MQIRWQAAHYIHGFCSGHWVYLKQHNKILPIKTKAAPVGCGICTLKQLLTNSATVKSHRLPPASLVIIKRYRQWANYPACNIVDAFEIHLNFFHQFWF